ncbi:MAG: pyridoxamine 5'-phosphate oxidase family protein [Methanoregula sp.]|jgi:nitroimidazol reductase NimA-like FMN-containing flavoprotein (pyridoxamine 5'-phosphate oxidase superfamily)|uniref:pyridoxamine 5'-phosphate oxidase family protein n=1 Tax=Methanoregula sp. TaxID=2052170 RepID=UPI003D143A8D
MRRKDREITDPAEMESILAESSVCRLALADGGEPYVVPLCFGYRDRVLYFHSAGEGKKIAMLRKNPRCCVEVDRYEGPLRDASPCKWEVRYKSVICTGTARIMDTYEEKRTGLNCILRQYGGTEYSFSEKEMERVCVVRVDILGMTGKKYGYDTDQS